MAKVWGVKSGENNETAYGYGFDCPGCGKTHVVPTNPSASQVTWKFSGDVNRPTFIPSLLCRTPMPDRTDVCHSIITDGRIAFQGDCTHSLKGQTVELPEIEPLTEREKRCGT